jgi:voltage-dependent calcium channel L type alpha-1D
MIGLGPSHYITDSYNRFDAFVVLCSIVEEIMFHTTDQSESGTDIFVAFKCLRLLRILKLLRSWKAL